MAARRPPRQSFVPIVCGRSNNIFCVLLGSGKEQALFVWRRRDDQRPLERNVGRRLPTSLHGIRINDSFPLSRGGLRARARLTLLRRLKTDEHALWYATSSLSSSVENPARVPPPPDRRSPETEEAVDPEKVKRAKRQGREGQGRTGAPCRTNMYWRKSSSGRGTRHEAARQRRRQPKRQE